MYIFLGSDNIPTIIPSNASNEKAKAFYKKISLYSTSSPSLSPSPSESLSPSSEPEVYDEMEALRKKIDSIVVL